MRLLLMLLLALCAAGAGAASRVEVFVLHSYSQEYPWTRRQHDGFLAGLQKDPARRYSVRAEYLDTKRVHYDEAYARTMAAHLAAKYAGYAPAVVYATDDNAFLFARDHLSRVFPEAPLVFSGVNDYGVRDGLDRRRITGVFERKEIAPNLQLVRLIAPEVREIVFVGDASETYRAIEQEVRAELANFPDVRARFVADRRLDRVLDGLRAGGERFLFLTTLGALVDDAGRPLALEDGIDTIVALGRHTVVSMEDVYLRKGVLGGYVTSGTAQGEAAARLVTRHAGGTPVADLAPVERSPNEYLLDGTELERTGIVLPPSIATQATLVNPVAGFLERHQRGVVIALYVLASMFVALLAGALTVVVRKNRQIGSGARELQRRAAEMAEVQDSLVRAQRIASLGTWDWRIAENRLYWSDEAYAILGVPRGSVAPGYDAFIQRVHPEDRAAVRAVMRQALATGSPCDHSYRVVRPGGEARVVRENAEVIRDAAGRPQRMIGTLIDITESKRSEDRLAFLASYDPVTRLPNRFLFGDRLAHAMRAAARGARHVALLYVDLDGFKHINDTLGHRAGDDLLEQVGRRLAATVRSADTVSRLGGDEFTLVLEDLEHDDQAARVATAILEQSARPYTLDGREVYVTPSIGIAVYPRDGDDADTLLMNADAAMYRAKENGRNGFVFFTRDINARARERLELGNRLREALARGEFSVHYQPKAALDDGRAIGFEALLRWRNDQLGSVSPAVFVPILEELGLIADVGEWVMREACRWAAALPVAGAAAPGVSVNLSARQFRQPGLERAVERALADSGLPASRLELEITESTLVDLESNLQTMRRLRQLGVGLSIDDFGTGYSSLSYLKRFPVDRLKIDASFVRDVASDPDDAAITVAIIGLAHHLHLRVIAEGVETAGQLAFLRRHGCDEAQGYLIARPMPAAQAAEWWAERSAAATAAVAAALPGPLAERAAEPA